MDGSWLVLIRNVHVNFDVIWHFVFILFLSSTDTWKYWNSTLKLALIILPVHLVGFCGHTIHAQLIAVSLSPPFIPVSRSLVSSLRWLGLIRTCLWWGWFNALQQLQISLIFCITCVNLHVYWIWCFLSKTQLSCCFLLAPFQWCLVLIEIS